MFQYGGPPTVDFSLSSFFPHLLSAFFHIQFDSDPFSNIVVLLVSGGLCYLIALIFGAAGGKIAVAVAAVVAVAVAVGVTVAVAVCCCCGCCMLPWLLPVVVVVSCGLFLTVLALGKGSDTQFFGLSGSYVYNFMKNGFE